MKTSHCQNCNCVNDTNKDKVIKQLVVSTNGVMSVQKVFQLCMPGHQLQ